MQLVEKEVASSGHIIGGNIEEGVHKFQHGFILGETINKIKGTILTADDQISFDNIKALFYGKSRFIYFVLSVREALTVCFSILNPPFRDNLKLRKSGIPEIFYCLDSA